MARSKKKQIQKPSSSLLSGRLRRPHPLDSSDPPPAKLSAKAGRTLIRSHHTLQKQLAQAKAQNDLQMAQKIQTEIDAKGGLEKYQVASISGQSAQRGGDSSKILLSWLQPLVEKVEDFKLRLLEVGALSPFNACAKSSLFETTHIDLHSQHPKIETQDFMARPLPTNDDEKFDIISLSLVLNYVPSPTGRGEMLRRTRYFLRRLENNPINEYSPSVFLVLPAPCLENSRYLDDERLAGIMESLGFSLAKSKVSKKLVYHLWVWKDEEISPGKAWPKTVLRSGGNRNNFTVVLE